jgi:putative transposase
MMREWFTALEIAEFGLRDMPDTRRAIFKQATKENWQSRPRAGKGGGREYHISNLPDSVQMELVEKMVDPVVRQAMMGSGMAQMVVDSPRAKPNDEDRRAARVAIVGLFQTFCNSSALSVMQAEKPFIRYYNHAVEIHDYAVVPAWVAHIYPTFSVGSLRNWRILKSKQNGWQALKDQYGNRKGSGLLEVAENGKIKEFIMMRILKQSHLTAGHVRDLVRAEFGQTVTDSNGQTKPLPHVRTFERFIRQWLEENKNNVEYIQNPDSYKNKFQLALGKADAGIERLNQVWEIDASPADILCVDGRYAIYAIIDVWSRRAMFSVSKTASTEGSLALLRKAMMTWGVPEVLKTDNGSDFVSKRFTCALGSLGIEQRLCQAYTPESKPFVERVIGTLQRDLMPTLPGFVGHNVADRKAIESRKSFSKRLGEADKDTFEIALTHEQLQDYLNQWAQDRYERRVHSALGVSPFVKAQSWAEPVRMIEDIRALDLLLAPLAGQDGLRQVGKKGLRINNGSFWDNGLIPWVGRTVFVRCDPDDLGRVYCFESIEGAYICDAVDIERLGANRMEATKAAKAERKRLENEEIAPIRRRINKLKAEDMAKAILEQDARENANIAAFPKASTAYQSPILSEAALATRLEKPKASTVQEQETHKIFVANFNQQKIAPEKDEDRWWRRAMSLEDALNNGASITENDQKWLHHAKTRPWYRAKKEFIQLRENLPA